MADKLNSVVERHCAVPIPTFHFDTNTDPVSYSTTSYKQVLKSGKYNQIFFTFIPDSDSFPCFIFFPIDIGVIIFNILDIIH